MSEGVHLGTWVGGACSDVEVVKELWCWGAEPVVSLCSPRGACGMRAWVLSLWLYIHLKYFFNEATSLRVSQTHTHTLSLIYYKAESHLFVLGLRPIKKRMVPYSCLYFIRGLGVALPSSTTETSTAVGLRLPSYFFIYFQQSL